MDPVWSCVRMFGSWQTRRWPQFKARDGLALREALPNGGRYSSAYGNITVTYMVTACYCIACTFAITCIYCVYCAFHMYIYLGTWQRRMTKAHDRGTWQRHMTSTHSLTASYTKWHGQPDNLCFFSQHGWEGQQRCHGDVRSRNFWDEI